MITVKTTLREVIFLNNAFQYLITYKLEYSSSYWSIRYTSKERECIQILFKSSEHTVLVELEDRNNIQSWERTESIIWRHIFTSLTPLHLFLAISVKFWTKPGGFLARKWEARDISILTRAIQHTHYGREDVKLTSSSTIHTPCRNSRRNVRIKVRNKVINTVQQFSY